MPDPKEFRKLVCEKALDDGDKGALAEFMKVENPCEELISYTREKLQAVKKAIEKILKAKI